MTEDDADGFRFRRCGRDDDHEAHAWAREGGMMVVIHRGPIPGTNIGHHWFDAADGNRYGIQGGPGPDGGNRGWAYEIVDTAGRGVDDSMFTLAEIRKWAAL